MAYKKTAHRRHRVRSSRRKNATSRKMMRGGGTNLNKCNAARPSNINDPFSDDMNNWRKRFQLSPNDNIFLACKNKYGDK